MDADAIAVEGMERIALGHENSFRILVGNDGVLAVGAAHENARGDVGAFRSLVFSRFDLDDLAVESHFGQGQGHSPLVDRGLRADGG